MSRTDPSTIFGVHTAVPYRRSNRIPYGDARVIQGSTFSIEGDQIELYGGSNRNAWKIEDGDTKAELSITISEYPDWVYELFAGKKPTRNAAEPSGNVGAISNVKGTSASSATTGVASAAAIPTTGAANLKAGRVILEATADDALKVYFVSDVDFGRGLDAEYLSDDLSVAVFAGIVDGSNLDIPTLGLRLVAGSAVNMTVGDTATLRTRPINKASRSTLIGGISDVFPEFGCVIVAQKAADDSLFEVDIFKLKASGITLGSERKQFGQTEYKAKASYDSAKGGLCEAFDTYGEG